MIALRINSGALYSLMTVMAVCMTATGEVVINEMELNPLEGGFDWVELYNSGNDSVDISNWVATITDGGWVGKMTVPTETIIHFKGFYILNGNPQWTHNGGGFVTLYSESGKMMDKTPYEQDKLQNDFTWGRHPDGHNTNTGRDWGFAYATKGKPNDL